MLALSAQAGRAGQAARRQARGRGAQQASGCAAGAAGARRACGRGAQGARPVRTGWAS